MWLRETARAGDLSHRFCSILTGGFMSDLPRTMNQREAIRLLNRHGWTKERGGGHAVKMTKPGHRPVVLSKHRGAQYSVSYTQAILKQAGLKGSGD